MEQPFKALLAARRTIRAGRETGTVSATDIGYLGWKKPPSSPLRGLENRA
jgi:hypothetical protein